MKNYPHPNYQMKNANCKQNVNIGFTASKKEKANNMHRKSSEYFVLKLTLATMENEMGEEEGQGDFFFFSFYAILQFLSFFWSMRTYIL